jgi:hypothetical protein
MTTLQLLGIVAAVTVLVVAISALSSVFTLWLSDRPERAKKRKPDKPRAANRNRQVSVPAHPLPMPVVYQEVTRLPVLDGDATEVRDPTRYDLLHEHVERGIRARRNPDA